jgi:hypothetical protein
MKKMTMTMMAAIKATITDTKALPREQHLREDVVIRVAQLNIHNLFKNHQDIPHLMKKYNFNVLFTQELGFTITQHTLICLCTGFLRKHGYLLLTIPHEHNLHAGTVIIIDTNILHGYNIIVAHYRYLSIQFTTRNTSLGHKLIITNVYGDPGHIREATRDLMHNIDIVLSKHSNTIHIVGGDWNAIVHPNDTISAQCKPFTEIMELIDSCHLTDLERELKGTCAYTYPDNGRACNTSRLDYFLISKQGIIDCVKYKTMS